MLIYKTKDFPLTSGLVRQGLLLDDMVVNGGPLLYVKKNSFIK